MKDKNKDETIELLKNWKYLDICYKCCTYNLNYENIKINILNQEIYFTKEDLIIFMKSFNKILEILNEAEFKVIELCYYHKYPNKKVMDELYLISSTFFNYKQNALKKLSDLIPALINNYRNQEGEVLL